MRVTPKISDRPDATRNRNIALASPLRSWIRRSDMAWPGRTLRARRRGRQGPGLYAPAIRRYLAGGGNPTLSTERLDIRARHAAVALLAAATLASCAAPASAPPTTQG